jgi:TRAP-type C4-dicarboxylate transport system substrate-binding protein
MKEAGAVINEVADRKPFQDAVKPVWDKYGAAHKALIDRIQAVK